MMPPVEGIDENQQRNKEESLDLHQIITAIQDIASSNAMLAQALVTLLNPYNKNTSKLSTNYVKKPKVQEQALHDNLSKSLSNHWTPDSNVDLKTQVKRWLLCPSVVENRYGHISTWDTSRITDMSSLFGNRYERVVYVDDYYIKENLKEVDFNEDISDWDFSNVTNMKNMFAGCVAFNQPLNKWNVSKVTNMEKMFSRCRSFNQPLDSWNTSAVTSMSGMFQECKKFNQTLNSWNVNNVADISYMF
jgi:surface protein